MKIAIIGAGPIGCYCGYLLAKSRHEVSIYENHAEIGLPIQCTGLLTSDIEQFGFHLDSFVINTFSSIQINTPNQSLNIKQKEYLVCRQKFDNYLADLAREAGAVILVNHTFGRKESDSLVIKDGQNKVEVTIHPEIVIAADGPLSSTAKAYEFYQAERKNYYGIQAIVEGKFDSQQYQTYFGREVCPELFAWVVPESATTARAGLAGEKEAKPYFDKFVKAHQFKVVSMQAGLIPLYHPAQKLKEGNCYLVGDASGFVKATTLGGIIPGLEQARILADCINNGQNYEVEVGSLRRKMKLHLRIHTILNKFKDKDWDYLLKLMAQPRIAKLFTEHTRDNPFPLLLKVLVKEPRFLYFLKYFI